MQEKTEKKSVEAAIEKAASWVLAWGNLNPESLGKAKDAALAKALSIIDGPEGMLEANLQKFANTVGGSDPLTLWAQDLFLKEIQKEFPEGLKAFKPDCVPQALESVWATLPAPLKKHWADPRIVTMFDLWRYMIEAPVTNPIYGAVATEPVEQAKLAAASATGLTYLSLMGDMQNSYLVAEMTRNGLDGIQPPTKLPFLGWLYLQSQYPLHIPDWTGRKGAGEYIPKEMQEWEKQALFYINFTAEACRRAPPAGMADQKYVKPGPAVHHLAYGVAKLTAQLEADGYHNERMAAYEFASDYIGSDGTATEGVTPGEKEALMAAIAIAFFIL